MIKCNSLLRNLPTVTYLQLCNCSNSGPKAIKYYGFEYFPRHENFKDPPYTPSKLFLVRRIKPVKGTNPVERKNLQLLNIDGRERYNGHINIVKNIPEINEKLWKVKHLVDIKPIIWKGELPKDSNYSGTLLKKTGEFVMAPRLKFSPEVLESTEKYLKSSSKMRTSYLKKYLLEKWVNNYTGGV